MTEKNKMRKQKETSFKFNSYRWITNLLGGYKIKQKKEKKMLSVGLHLFNQPLAASFTYPVCLVGIDRVVQRRCKLTSRGWRALTPQHPR